MGVQDKLMAKKRNYNTSKLPLEGDLSKFALPHTPEKFSKNEASYLRPFFSNIDRPIFAIHGLPEEVIGALSSRYSRATKSLRRMFLDEYVGPIINPENQKDWSSMKKKAKNEAYKTRDKFKSWIVHINETGGIDDIVNVQRGRKFFDKWLAQYGDDSIAEMGGVHLSIEGASNIAINEVEAKRIGISPLEKSSRYVQFWEKRPDGNYQYIIPGELKGTREERIYREAMDELFALYANIADPYKEYIKDRYPMGDDETERSFENSRSAKRFDDIRDFLPFATQTSVALSGNGRAFEDLINRLAAHPIGEIRWLAQQITLELQSVVPSFVTRPMTKRGAEMQLYRANMEAVRKESSSALYDKRESKYPRWVNLIDHTPDPEVEVLSTFLFKITDLSLDAIKKQVAKMSSKKRRALFESIFSERDFGSSESKRQEVRFRKVPRAFENALFLFDVYGRGGDFRDLHRHRQMTQERQKFTTRWGYDLEKDVLDSPFIDEIASVLEKTNKAFRKISKINPYIAQYIVPFGFVQHWYMNITAREIFWMIEIRTGPQGREHYRQICQDIAKKASEVAPNLFAGLMTDWGSYSLSRRESEKKIDKKLLKLKKLGS